MELTDYDGFYLITDDGYVIGSASVRIPRKIKKQLKKNGQYNGRLLRPLPLKKLNP